MALSDIQALVDGMVRVGGAAALADDRDAAIGVAVARYGRDRPRQAVDDIAAAGGVFLGLPAAWVDGSSTLVEMEEPIDADPPSRILPAEIRLDLTPAGARFRLPRSLSAGALVRVRFTAPHLLSDVEDTIPAADREAVAAYAGAHLLDALAVGASGDTDSSINAVAVNRATPAQEYAARAKELRRRYVVSLGINPDRVAPAGAVVSLPGTDSLGRDRLLHPRMGR